MRELATWRFCTVHHACNDPECEAQDDFVPASKVEGLVDIADAAWRIRTVLNLNIEGLLGIGTPASTRNLVDALNDLNEHLPLAEDGKWWATYHQGAAE